MPSSTRQLLPPNVAPVTYDLTFEPELQPSQAVADLLTPDPAADDPAVGRVRADPDLTFRGRGDIRIVVSEEPIAAIHLHSQDLKIQDSEVREPTSGKVFKVEAVREDPVMETISLVLSEPLVPGEYIIGISWNGILNNKMQGFYRSAYKDASGLTRHMAVTQFEPTDARKAFPCFDEPARKAKFRVTLIAPCECVCLSNMPEEAGSQTTESGKRLVRFQETPIMSTYLLAFIVGELDSIEVSDRSGTLIRVWTLPGSGSLGEFALSVAKSTLEFFTDFFGEPYPLPKCDLVAVPDFAAGAMENWGCITFRETALLLDPQNSSASAKSRVAEVVAHELAHQWFGNLVTMEWWTHLWLNEGFATWAADLAVDNLFPRWEVWMQFVCTTLSSALRLDALESSHPIEVEVNRAAEVNEIFDAISYSKGASAIRMLVDFMGLEKFQAGLRTYFKLHPYKNTSTEDLWRALKTVSTEPIEEMMRGWTQQTGFPVVRVQKTHEGNIEVVQERFSASGASESDTQWIVPISFVTSQGADEVRKALLNEKRSVLLLAEEFGSMEWIKLNASQSGIYRVLYTPELYGKLGPPLLEKTLSCTDRLGLLMDAMALARAGYLETPRALDVLSFFKEEHEYTCLVDVVGSLDELTTIFGQSSTAVADQFDSFAQSLLVSAGEKLGWEPQSGEEHVVALARTLVLTALADHGHGPTIEKAKTRFAEFLSDPASLPADLRIPVYYTAIKYGGDEEYDAMLGLYHKSELNEENVRCMRALGKARSPELLSKTLQWGMEEVKPQDMVFVIHAVASNPLGRELAWSFVRENWTAFVNRYGRGNFLLTRFIEYSTKGFCLESHAQEVDKFFETVPKDGIERTIDQCLEGILVRSRWRARDEAQVQSWMATASA